MLYSAFYFVQLTKTQLTFQHMVECVNNVERTGHRQLRIPLVLTQRDESLCLLPREGNVGRPQPHCPVRNKMRLRPRDGELEEIERGAGHRAGDGLLDQVQGPHQDLGQVQSPAGQIQRVSCLAGELTHSDSRLLPHLEYLQKLNGIV